MCCDLTVLSMDGGIEKRRICLIVVSNGIVICNYIKIFQINKKTKQSKTVVKILMHEHSFRKTLIILINLESLLSLPGAAMSDCGV